MTEHDYQYEQDLRAQTQEKGAQGAAQILADFYEQIGQPSRAMLWRRPGRVHAQRKLPADLIVHDSSWRRHVVMWLLGHVTSQVKVAKAFRSSESWARTLIKEVEQRICEAANEERHRPTMAATRRLQAVGALPKPYEPSAFSLGEPPPDHWPDTRDHRRKQ